MQAFTRIRHSIWVVISLAACGQSGDSANGKTDARPAASADAAPIRDGRATDAPPAIDGGVMADATLLDAAQALTLRPYSGATARLRVVDGETLAGGGGMTVCLFGNDADPRPYSVLGVLNGVTMVPNVYSDVPAGIVLRVSVNIDLPGSPNAGRPEACVGPATPFHYGSALAAGVRYTGVRRAYELFPCQDHPATRPFCEYAPQLPFGQNDSDCIKDKVQLFVLRDGDGVHSTGFRLVNLTTNASSLDRAVMPNGSVSLSNVAVFPEEYPGGEPFDAITYDPSQTSLARVCPAYLDCYDGLTPGPWSDGLSSCWAGADEWTVATIAGARLSGGLRTFYLVGEAPYLDSTGKLSPFATQPLRIIETSDAP